ncbi:fructose-2,6-bisphosphatase [Pandoraea pulmonicola]|uniref:Bifunctional RNase H/acid phosphatase n=1 Tax=Pandoraea pulmonicola TaxID=93221 RepID=A0AAJ5CZ17_PANPU|nr:fructose-2,6-bisphosphatase [Pandoraea pulmonicola]SUA89137.1 bifunctional RNase H/acid phosphatase [Pandoraea pulmonicola]
MSSLGHPGPDTSPLAFTPPQRRRIYLMRHGDVTYFDDSGKPIDADAVPLNEQGRAQASAAGRAFAAENIRFDRVIVSGLPRTRETAERVLAETGQQVEIETWTCWQEIRAGNIADLSPGDLAQAFLAAFDGVVPEDTRFLNGESVRELLERVVPPLAELRADRSWDTVLLVLHGGVNRAILSHAMHPLGRLFIGQLAQTPACINALDVGDKPEDWIVRLLNFAPPQPLHRDNRLTVMEKIFASFTRSLQRR